jgi:hypothetical protein
LHSSPIFEYIPDHSTGVLAHFDAVHCPEGVVVGTRGRKAWQSMIMDIRIADIWEMLVSESRSCISHIFSRSMFFLYMIAEVR